MEFSYVFWVTLITWVSGIIGTFACYLRFKMTIIFKAIFSNIAFAVLGYTVTMFVFTEFTVMRVFCVGVGFALFGQLITMSLMKNLHSPVKTILEELENYSKGNFTNRIEVQAKGELEQIANHINHMITEFSFLIDSIQANISENHEKATELSTLSVLMSDKAKNTSSKADNVSTAAEEMKSNMTTIADAVKKATLSIGVVTDKVLTAAESNTATINEIAQETEKALQVTSSAVIQAKNTSEKVEELGRAAQNINKVTETITEISEQTNLLALNATIEAARAGEAGKGFAVVAGEIKELARQTADATQEIKSMIESMQQTAMGTMSEINQISNVINDCNYIVTSISVSVEEQAVTTKEIARNINQASIGMNEINENVHQSLSVSEQISTEMSDINLDANDISTNSSKVKTNAVDLSLIAHKLQAKAEKFVILENNVA